MTTNYQRDMDTEIGGLTRRLGQPLPADWLQHLGWFRFNFDDDRWTWSPQLEQMHGYEPGATAPSTLLLLSHVHLDDHDRLAAALHNARRTCQPFSSRHHIVDIHGQVHDVVMVGAPIHDTGGAVLGMHGLLLDLSRAAAPAHDRRYEHATNQLRILADGNGFTEPQRRRIRAATRC